MEKYSECKNSAEVLQVQNNYLEEVQKEKQNRSNKPDDYPTFSSTSEESESENEAKGKDEEEKEETKEWKFFICWKSNFNKIIILFV